MIVFKGKKKKHSRFRTISKSVIEVAFRSRTGTAVAHINQKQRIHLSLKNIVCVSQWSLTRKARSHTVITYLNAIAEPAAIIGHDGIPISEVVSDPREATTTTTPGDQEQQKAGVAHLIGQVRTRQAQGILFCETKINVDADYKCSRTPATPSTRKITPTTIYPIRARFGPKCRITGALSAPIIVANQEK